MGKVEAKQYAGDDVAFSEGQESQDISYGPANRSLRGSRGDDEWRAQMASARCQGFSRHGIFRSLPPTYPARA